MIYAHELILRFQKSDHDFIQSFLFEEGITTFQEGEMAEDTDGNVELINEDTLIKIFSESKAELEDLSKRITKELPDISTSLNEITTNFNETWKEFSKPIIVNDRILIQPNWLEFQERREIELLLDPGLAFGSGSHETTLLCMRKLEEVLINNRISTLLDVGCGSGILSILASKLGVKNVWGIDCDELAIVASKDNALKNNTLNLNLSSKQIKELDLKFDLVVANIISSVLTFLLEDIKSALAPTGILILSGLLREEMKEFKKLHGLDHFEEEVLGEWGVIWGIIQ